MRNKDFGILIVRLAIGGLMLFHGAAKLLNGVDGIVNMLAGKAIPAFVAYGVYLGEIIAPLFIIIGYRMRLASLVFMANMLVILFVAHAADLLTLSPHGGWSQELSGLYLLGALALFFTGAGKYALSSSTRWD